MKPPAASDLAFAQPWETPGDAARRAMGRLLLLVAASVSVVSGGLLVAALVYLRQEAVQVSEELTDMAAQWVEAQTSRTIETVDQRLQLALAGLPGRGPASARDFLSLQREGLASVTAIRLLGPDGRQVHASGPDAGARDYADRPFFQAHRSDPNSVLQIGEPVFDPTAGAWVISVSRAARRADGALEAVMVADLAPQHFDGLWRTGAMRPGESITLLRRDGVLLARSPRDQAPVGHPIPELALLREPMARSLSGRFQGSTEDGGPGSFSYRTVSAEPTLIVLVSQSFDRMLAPWRRLALVAGAVWVLGSGGVVVLCMVLAKAWYQRFRAEAGLEKMAQRLTLATATAGIGIWDWNLRDNQWWASDTYSTMLGYASDAPTVEYEQWLERIHPEDRAMVDARIQAALSQVDHPYGYEARQRHADGSYRWIKVVGRVLQRGEDGRALRLLGVRSDITERKTAGLALQHAKEHAENLISTANAMIIGFDVEGVVTIFNHAAEQVTGFASNEMLGRDGLGMLVPADRLDVVRASFKRALGGEGARVSESTILTRSGQERLIAWQNSQIREGDAVTGMLSCGIDLTERRRAEDALQASEERYRKLVDFSPHAIGLVVDGILCMVNPATLVLFRATAPEQLLSHPIDELVHPEQRASARERITRMLAGDYSAYPAETRFLRLDGTAVDVETSVAPLTFRNQPALQVIATDITQRKQAEAALQETTHLLAALSRRVLEAQETERRRVARELHDELGGALTTIKINLQAGPRQHGRSAEVLQGENIAIVENALQQVRRLALALRPSVLDDLGLVPALHWMAEQSAGRNDFTVHFQATVPPGRLASDIETACFRIAQEALTNIARYARPTQVEIDLMQDGDALILCVTDDGCGFDVPAMRQRARAGGSIGVLGMQERATLVGGRLDIESAPGKGTTVRMRCPWREREDAA